MECRTAIEYINLYVDNMLSGDETEMLLEHIRNCEGCKKELDDITALKNKLSELDELEPPAGLAMSAVRKAKKRKLPIFAYASAGIAAVIALAVILSPGGAPDGMRNLAMEKASYYGESAADYAADDMYSMEAPQAAPAPAEGAPEMLEGCATLQAAEEAGGLMQTKGAAAYIITVPPERQESVRSLIDAFIGEYGIEAELADNVISFIIPEEYVEELEDIIAVSGVDFENTLIGGCCIEFIFQ